MTFDDLIKEMDAIGMTHAASLERRLNAELAEADSVEVAQAMQHLQFLCARNHAAAAHLLEHVIQQRLKNELLNMNTNTN